MRTLLKDIVKQVQRKSQKQTSEEVSEERIAEWKRKFTAENRVPGVIGIRNHGNTCFINAILQCLSYTDILAEYFVLDMYKGDLKRKKKLQTLTALYKRNASVCVAKVKSQNNWQLCSRACGHYSTIQRSLSGSSP